MLAKVCSAPVNGVEAFPVEVEVNASFDDSIIVILVDKTPGQGFGWFPVDFRLRMRLP